MKKLTNFALEYLVILPLARILFHLGEIALVFAGSIIIALVAGFGFGVPFAFAYLSVAWKVYLGFGLFTIIFLTTFEYLNCCWGMQSLWQHMRTAGTSAIAAHTVVSLVWPWAWFVQNWNLKRIGASLASAIYFCGRYWAGQERKKISIMMFDSATGEMRSTKAGSYGEVLDFIEKEFVEKPGAPPAPPDERDIDDRPHTVH